MAAPIIIASEIKTPEINQATGEIKKQLTSALVSIQQEAKKAAESMRGVPAALDRTAREALRLAQAEARLQQASGDLAGAQRTLQTALAGVTQQTTQTIGAK